MDLQNSFTAAKSTKFPITAVLVYPPHLNSVVALPWESETRNSSADEIANVNFLYDDIV